jgi:DNA-binding transcriptional regulator PaaX
MKLTQTVRTPTVTRAGVLFLFRRPGVVTMTQTEIGANFGVSSQAATKVVQYLLSTGQLVRERRGSTQHYSLAASQRGDKGLVSAFRPDNWKPPMHGYEASLRSFEAMAMATRR